MKIEHISLWTIDLERLKNFYARYFGGKPGEKYVNAKKNFTSYFLIFDSGARLEIMHRPDITDHPNDPHLGFIHLAFATGSVEMVDQLTETLRYDDYKIVREPRVTGDGYYESVVLDPDGNYIEITV